MTFLTLIRHAKTEQHSADGTDEGRRLLPRGITDAQRIGSAVLAGRPRPDIILGSTAQRVRETVDVLQAVIPGLPAPDFLEDLYLADEENLWTTVSPFLALHREIWLVGHNPGIHALIEALTGTILSKVPTMSVARVSISDDALLPGTGKLESFSSPKHL